MGNQEAPQFQGDQDNGTIKDLPSAQKTVGQQ
jgi:hypothetical protein